MRSSIVDILKKSSLLLVSTICALIVAEVFVRVFSPTGNRPGKPGGQLTKTFWTHDELLGWRQLPNVVSSWNAVPVVINSKGLRDKEYTYERRPGFGRMLVLGDSYVWGWGVKLEDMFTKVIESQRDNLEVISMGVPGYSTDQEFLWLNEEGIKYKPDILLLLLQGADFTTDLVYMHDGRYKPMFVLKNGALELTHVPVPDVPIIRKIHFFLRSYSYLYMFLYKRELTRLGKIAYEKIIGKPLFQSSPPEPSAAVDRGETDYKYQLTLKILKEMNNLCKENGIRFVVAGHGMLPEMIKIIDSLAGENGFYFIDLDSVLMKFTSANPGKEIRLGKADNHWNPLGHKIVAEAITDYLDEHRLWPRLSH
jgi:hypothetical protein